MRTLLACGLLALLPLSAPAAAPRGKRVKTLVTSAKEAKAIAEQDTGGRAVSARRIPLNGASGGWEVDLRMPGEARGWRCIIDSDTHMVHSKARIDQPGAKGKDEGPVRMIHGTR